MNNIKWKNIDELLGYTIINIKVDTVDGNIEELYFERNDGKIVLMFHDQNCCESVFLYDIDGYWDDLINSKIIEAEMVESDIQPENATIDGDTWTYYKISTSKGSISLRWIGSSNGYYSESVNIALLNKYNDPYNNLVSVI